MPTPRYKPSPEALRWAREILCWYKASEVMVMHVAASLEYAAKYGIKPREGS